MFIDGFKYPHICAKLFPLHYKSIAESEAFTYVCREKAACVDDWKLAKQEASGKPSRHFLLTGDLLRLLAISGSFLDYFLDYNKI